MMPRPHECDRTRLLASLAADGEISDLELASLHAHLARCAACAAYAEELGELVRALREAPLVESELPVFRPLPAARRRWSAATKLAASAAAVAAALALGSFAGSLTSGGGSPAPSRAAIAATQEPYVEQNMLAMLRRVPERTPRGPATPV
jgi:anti-sigma factor RsiW